MDSRHLAEDAVARLKVSKRALVVASAAGLLPPKSGTVGATADPSLAICELWLALDRSREDLLMEWSAVEAALMRDHEWQGLSPDLRAVHTGSLRLAEIDRQLERLYEEGEAVLALLPSAPAKKIETIIAHLSLAERLLPAEENDQVHGMIARAVHDLKALTARP